MPPWLHNKPKKYVKHCDEKAKLGQEIPVENVKANGEIFFVKSMTSKDVTYEVFFGDATLYPSCECFEWKKKLMPCKHMFAVMEHIHETNWEFFCPKYKDSAFFKIDFEVIGLTDVQYLDNKDVSDEDSFLSNDNDMVEKFEDISLPVYKKSTKSSECREILNQIKSLTLTASSEDTLNKLKILLKECLHMLQDEVRTDHGLIVEENATETKRTCPEINLNQPGFEQLLIPKRQKSSLTGRVGVASDARRATTNISVLPKKQKKEQMLIEETVIEDEWHGFDVKGGDNREYRKESLLSETEKGEKAKTISGYKEKCDFKIIYNINIPFRDVILRNGCHSITHLDLISLEVSHNQSQLAKTRKDDVIFARGSYTMR